VIGNTMHYHPTDASIGDALVCWQQEYFITKQGNIGNL
jgi:DNA gyrase/topoisomerase IV subunit A